MTTKPHEVRFVARFKAVIDADRIHALNDEPAELDLPALRVVAFVEQNPARPRSFFTIGPSGRTKKHLKLSLYQALQLQDTLAKAIEAIEEAQLATK